MKLFLLLAVVCLTHAQKEPQFSRSEDGGIDVVIPGFPGVQQVTLKVSGVKTEEHTVLPTQSSGVHCLDKNFVCDRIHNSFETMARLNNQQLQWPQLADAILKDGRQLRFLMTSALDTSIAASGGIQLLRTNDEFEMYTPEPANSHVKNGALYICPTLTVDKFGDNFLNSGHLDIKAQWGRCDSSSKCDLHGYNHIPPIMSAKLTSTGHIRHGKVEVVAKLPKGDWLWPAIWMLPTEHHYGGWPRSGEIDIMEDGPWVRTSTIPPYTTDRRGTTRKATDILSTSAYHYFSTLGPPTLHGTTFGDAFHTFWMDWTADHIRIGVDDHTVLAVNTPSNGYWQEGHFSGTNIWANGGKDAPFDRPFNLILNVAVGGNWFHSNNKNSPYPQPWHDDWENKMMEFWSARHLWEPTWHGEDVCMKVRSVKLVQY
ncbi:hypothetical protein BaRGS_00003000 [Batillaria attramentaria]|uniref:GH16 domain-containing protein n=1 Tax=Batillaria attramentaria TaxID=370345 RepID=A0ABD0M1D2_9CAEN